MEETIEIIIKGIFFRVENRIDDIVSGTGKIEAKKNDNREAKKGVDVVEERRTVLPDSKAFRGTSRIFKIDVLEMNYYLVRNTNV